MSTIFGPNYVILEFDEPVTPEVLDAIEKAVVHPHEIPELLRATTTAQARAYSSAGLEPGEPS